MRASLWAIASFAPPASRFFAQAQSERSANPAALSFQKEGERFSLSSEETAGVRTSILQTNFSILEAARRSSGGGVKGLGSAAKGGTGSRFQSVRQVAAVAELGSRALRRASRPLHVLPQNMKPLVWLSCESSSIPTSCSRRCFRGEEPPIARPEAWFAAVSARHFAAALPGV